MTVKIPTLTAKGFVESIEDKIERAMPYSCTSEYSQSDKNRGNVASLPCLGYRYGNNANHIRQEVEGTLSGYLHRVFDEAIVTCVTEEKHDRINLQINAIVRDNGETRNVGYVIGTTNNKVIDVFDINNDGYIGKRS